MIIEKVKASEFPEARGRSSAGKWDELHIACGAMDVGEIYRFLMDNKKEAQTAQSSLQGTRQGKKRANLKEQGYRFETRTAPVDSPNGKFYLYVKRVS